MKNELGLTVKKQDDMPEWYSQVVLKSEMADYSAVRGCMILRPLGMKIWETIQAYFNERIKQYDVQNAYFPLFIPESFLMKEASHIDGFAPEVAWIERKEDTQERLAVRPTSESIMYDSYAKWIRSHRDLPLKLNQWANVVRWEVSDVKLFLRSREFLWQEGHCVYETEQECEDDVLQIIKEYQKLSEELLAVPAFIGKKSVAERFAGAEYTYTIESFMPDGKALQAGTSHHLGTNFSKAFNITYRGRDEQFHHPFQNSWGFSTRIMGSLIMTHSDDKGLVLPPRVAPIQVVIVPILHDKYPLVLDAVKEIQKSLKDIGVTVYIDDSNENSLGFKRYNWELKGVPIRLELGPKDLENKQCVLVKRNTGEKLVLPLHDVTKIKTMLNTIHNELYEKAKQDIASRTIEVSTYDELVKGIEDRNIVIANHCGQPDCEKSIKEEMKATTRYRPEGCDSPTISTCVKCNNESAYRIVFSKNY